jgi:hypothetical protein
MKHKREYYIPKNATKIQAKDSTAVCYIYEKNGKEYALGFHGRAQKPDWHFTFVRPNDRESRIINHFASIKAHEDNVAKRRAKEKAPHTLNEGDLLYCSWGYDQTNIDFYQVVRVVSDRTVEIRAINGNVEETGNMTGRCSPIRNAFKKNSPVLKKRVSGDNAIRMNSYSYAHPCGERESFRWSSYA